MASTFPPRREADLVTWTTSFDAQITATPVAFGISAGQASSYHTLSQAFLTQYALANNDGTRTPAVIAAKNAAKAAMLADARVLIRVIQAFPSLTNSQRLSLGIRVPVVPQPIPAPNRAPGIEVKSVNGRTLSVRIFDPANMSRKGLPPGIDGVSVFSFVGPTAPEDPTAYKFEGSTTRSVFNVQFPLSVAEGSKVWITAFYFNPRSEAGPACSPISAYTQFGGDMPMAA